MSTVSTKKAKKMVAGSLPFDIVNLVGYVLGVEKDILLFGDRWKSKYEYQVLQKKHELRVMRTLCLLRDEIMRNYNKFSEGCNMRTSKKALCELTNCRDLIDAGMECFGRPMSLVNCVRAIEDELIARLPTLRGFIPDWFGNKDYLCEQVLLDWNGSATDFKEICSFFSHNRVRYPAFVYMKDGHRLSNRVMRDDRDLTTELYALHGEVFDQSKFPFKRGKTNAQVHVEKITEFCKEHAPISIEIDTQNIDATATISFLQQLNLYVPDCVKDIKLYLDGTEGKLYRHFDLFTDIEVTPVQLTRIRSQKSIMDTAIIASITERKYSGKPGGVLLLSSDCDFLMLHTQFPDYPICYCMMKRNAADSTVAHMQKNDIPCVFVDYIVNSAMLSEIEAKCVKTYVEKRMGEELPELSKLLYDSLREICPRGSFGRYVSDIRGVWKKTTIKINQDGTNKVYVPLESVVKP